MARPKNRKKLIIGQYRQTMELAQAILKNALDNNEPVDLPMLREISGLGNLAMRYLKAITVLQQSEPTVKYFVPIRRAQVIRLHDAILEHTRLLTKEISKDPGSVVARTISSLTTISSRALKSLDVLLDMEHDQQQERIREKQSGMTQDELDMIKEFDKLDLGVGSEELESFETVGVTPDEN